MRLKHCYIILLLPGIVVSCKKKSYPSSTIENGVVYYFKGDVNGSQVLLEAGNDDYYMYTTTSASSISSNVVNFAGNLKKANCSTCAPGLQIIINDYRASSGSAGANIDSSLMVRHYPLISSGPFLPYLAVFQSAYNKTAASYLWDFGDGTTSTVPNPSHIYDKNGNYNVCLNIKGSNGCSSNICSEQKIGAAGNVCKTSISVSSVNAKVITFAQMSSGTGTLNYFWDFGDGSSSNQPNPSHTFPVHGSYPISLRVTDANKNMAIARYNAITQNDASSCAANYQLFAEIIATNSPFYLNLSGAIITWTDANGVTYSSNNPLQPSVSFLEVLSVENGETNEDGLKTKKIRLRFKAKLYSGNNLITIDNVDALIGMAYK